MEFGDWLKKFRADHGLTQRQVAEALGKREGDISRWESGRNIPQEPEFYMRRLEERFPPSAKL